MKRSKLAFALSLLMSVGLLSPAMAAEDEGLDKAVQGSLIGTRLGGLGAGLVVGVPVAVTRQVVKSYKDMTNSLADKVGGHEFGPSVALVSLVTVPASLVYGGATGTFYGGKNAFVHGFNEPFTGDSFSLGKLEE
ncbi:MAG TPA: hypothetical protein V6D17_13505 [Candidatus Obscuribacterales bacterium]